MKARLAKKLVATSINRLAPRWRNSFVRHDVRIAKALSMRNKITEQRS